MNRRSLLRYGATLATLLTIPDLDGDPTGRPDGRSGGRPSVQPADRPGQMPYPVSSDLLDRAETNLTSLRRSESRDGPAAVSSALVINADYLLRSTSMSPRRLRSRVAALAADAAAAAGWCARELGEHESSLAWYLIAVRAAHTAGGGDMVPLCLGQQAYTLYRYLDRPADALALLDRLPTGRATPTAVAVVELGRADLLARAGRPDGCWRALERAETALTQASPGESGKALWYVHAQGAEVYADKYRARAEAALGFSERAYQRFAAALQHHPGGVLYRDYGSVQLELAKAAAGMGEPAVAAEHAGRAYRILAATGSTIRLVEAAQLRDLLVAEHGHLPAVADLDELLRSTPDTYRYVRVLARYGPRWKVHLERCPQLKRRTTADEPWPVGNGLTPDQVRALLDTDPAVGVDHAPCRHCLKTRRRPGGR